MSMVITGCLDTQCQDATLSSTLSSAATGVLNDRTHLAASDTGGRGFLGRLHRCRG
jgi:hypothetical protein